MDRVIKIYKGEETGIIIENYDSHKNSIFAEQYDMALKAIKTYLDSSKIDSKDSEATEKSSVNDRSNIFAFIGDRGTGKTSCMQSVADMLKPYYKEKQQKDLKSLVLPIVDPTIFDDKTNILQVILGVLFERFKSCVTKNCCCGEGNEEKYDKKKNSVIEAFQDVKKCLGYISKSEDLINGGDDISKIADMASVSKLHSLMGKLIECYLDFFDNEVLILQVDDIDLQTKYAYRMVEEIRKYFVLKNVVILMSFKLEQLSKVIELENAKIFKPLKEFDLISSADIELMAAKYILKLIPINQRIYMPTFELYADSALEYYIKKEDLSPKYKYDSVKYAVTSLIYIKCRFLFYHSRGIVSPIVPRNLRELRFLFAMLAKMKDYYKDGKDSDATIQQQNKKQFLDYFYNTWVDINISAENIHIVNSIISIRDAASINKVVVGELNDKYGDVLSADYKEIVNIKNLSFNISIADVYSILDYLKLKINKYEDRMLIFFIETFYSIMLYQYYDELTAIADTASGEVPKVRPSEQKNDEEDEFDENDYTDESIRRLEVVDGISNYELLVGGLFINTDLYHFMPLSSDRNDSLDKMSVNIKLLKQKVEDILKADKDNKTIDFNELQIVEFISLCISRLLEATKNRGNIEYRTFNEVLYRYKYTSKYNSAEFDLGAFFFNIVSVENAYNRINPDLFWLTNKHKANSLYGKLLDKCHIERDGWCPTPEHSLLSCSAIRNYEILDDLIIRTQYKWTLRSEGSLAANLKKFFNRVGGYQIKTYDRHFGIKNDEDTRKIKGEEKGKPSVISFKYAKYIAEVLQMCGKGKKYEKYFNSFFADGTDEFVEFDVERLMEYFPSADYAPVTIKARLHKACKSIFDSDKKWDEFLDDLIKHSSPDGKKRIPKQRIKGIITQLDLEYKKHQPID